MLYYYNVNGKFQKESSKEYKTEKGAIDKLTKEGKGAVYDEEGTLIMSIADSQEVPEGALETNQDGSVPAFDENGQMVGTVDAETVEKLTGSTPEPEGDAEPEGAPEPEVDAEPEGEPELGVDTEPEGEPEPERNAEPEDESEPEGNAEHEDTEPEKDTLPYFVRTTCNKLKVRNKPDPNASVIGYIKETEPEKRNYEVTEEKDGWGRISLDNLDSSYKGGWIMLAFTKKVD